MYNDERRYLVILNTHKQEMQEVYIQSILDCLAATPVDIVVEFETEKKNLRIFQPKQYLNENPSKSVELDIESALKLVIRDIENQNHLFMKGTPSSVSEIQWSQVMRFRPMSEMPLSSSLLWIGCAAQPSFASSKLLARRLEKSLKASKHIFQMCLDEKLKDFHNLLAHEYGFSRVFVRQNLRAYHLKTLNFDPFYRIQNTA